MVNPVEEARRAAASLTRLVGTPNFTKAFRQAKRINVHSDGGHITSLALLWATTEAMEVEGDAAVFTANLLLWDASLLLELDKNRRASLIEKRFRDLEQFDGWHEVVVPTGLLTWRQITELIANRLREEDAHSDVNLKEGARRQAFYAELTKEPSVYASHFNREDLMDVMIILQRQTPKGDPSLGRVMVATWERRYGHPFKH